MDGEVNDQQRHDEIAAALRAVTERVAAACRRAGRSPDEVRMIAVTKTFPASDAAVLADLGVRDFGENRVQEAAAKVEEVARLRPEADVRWHMLGRLQRNKARSVARWAAEVQSVDSLRLADTLTKAVRAALDSGERDRPLDVLVQVSLDDDPSRGGCPVDDLSELADTIARQSDLLHLRGVMAVAPLGVDPAPAFDRLASISEMLRKDHPGATEISAGMSGDLDQAIAYGSTCVRVGTALLGGRGLASP
ncbi:YggS family pyridoxal phosphate-dependent enzyme [Saccharomonospora sp. NB11]|jgi:pyridoxal phosphate enzyme (YggS family)|uniref:YggS family pyridoxal phosphate-dependent enzyme n=1 Tax=Saccharomonospora sp. NB11 TaxID=1642298 RepID=UPI0018D08FA9|nr:YggS family pyridoxal phosphate-dependent enzyme [Saccharomonospora sp. NB11]